MKPTTKPALLSRYTYPVICKTCKPIYGGLCNLTWEDRDTLVATCPNGHRVRGWNVTQGWSPVWCAPPRKTLKGSPR